MTHAQLTSDPSPALDARALPVVVAGTAAFGAAAAAGHGLAAMLRGAALAPALFAGGAALALPPLYIFTALAGGGATTAQVTRASARALHAVALVLLGLAAPAADFSVTMRTPNARELLLGAVAVLGAVGVFATAAHARAQFPGRGRGLALWCLFALALGARLIAVLAPLAFVGGR